jgi:hypothetical protein
MYIVFDSVVRSEDNAGIITLRQKTNTPHIKDEIEIMAEELEFFDELLSVDSLVINVEKKDKKFSTIHFRTKMSTIKFTDTKKLVLNRHGNLVLSTKEFYDFVLGFLMFNKQPYFYTIHDPINNHIFTTLNHVVCQLDLPSTIDQSISKSMEIIHRFKGFKKITCRWVDCGTPFNHKCLHPTIHHTPKQIQQLLNHDFITGGILLHVTGLKNSEQCILFKPHLFLHSKTNSCGFEYSNDNTTCISSKNYSFYHLLVHLAIKDKQPRQKKYIWGYVGITGTHGIKYCIDDFKNEVITSNSYDFDSETEALNSSRRIIDRINRFKLFLAKQLLKYLINLWRQRQEKIKQIQKNKNKLIDSIKEKCKEIQKNQEINNDLLKKYLFNWQIKVVKNKVLIYQKKQDVIYAFQRNAVNNQRCVLYFDSWANYVLNKNIRRVSHETKVSQFLIYRNELILEKYFYSWSNHVLIKECRRLLYNRRVSRFLIYRNELILKKYFDNVKMNGFNKKTLRPYFDSWANYVLNKNIRRVSRETKVSNYLIYRNKLIYEKYFYSWESHVLIKKCRRLLDNRKVSQFLIYRNELILKKYFDKVKMNGFNKRTLLPYFDSWANYVLNKNIRRVSRETTVSNYLNYRNELILEKYFDGIKMSNKINDDENLIEQLIDTVNDKMSDYVYDYIFPALGVVLITVGYYWVV